MRPLAPLLLTAAVVAPAVAETPVKAAGPAASDAVIAERFGADGVRAVLEFLADKGGCVLEADDSEETVDQVVAFLAFNVAGVHNLPVDFSPEAEAELRARVADLLDDPGPAFVAEPGRFTLIDCTP